MIHKKISFIGAGNMPRSIISGLVDSGYSADAIMASNPSRPKLDALAEDFKIQVTQSNHQACDFADVIVLSVKPQLMQQVCADIAVHCDLSDKLVISIAAGIPTARLQAMLEGFNNIVRTMPNTPSSMRLGMTGLYADEHIRQADKDMAGYIMQQVGEILWVKQEDAINGVIAAAGSSPAYLFLFAQAMQDEAMQMGFSKADARLLVQQALLGSASMICNNPTLDLSELRAQVTSKGGTTHEAVQSLIQDNIQETVGKAMRAAVTRAEQMSEQF